MGHGSFLRSLSEKVQPMKSTNLWLTKKLCAFPSARENWHLFEGIQITAFSIVFVVNILSEQTEMIWDLLHTL